ncbi:hypothetical protein Anas_09954, partial [Armadillidium nasatum]
MKEYFSKDFLKSDFNWAAIIYEVIRKIVYNMKKLNSKKKKLNAKVDPEKVKEVKLMIETLKDFIGNGDKLKGNESTVGSE